MEMYDVNGIRQLAHAATAPITTVTASSDSHEAGGARRRVDEGGRIGTIIMT